MIVSFLRIATHRKSDGISRLGGLAAMVGGLVAVGLGLVIVNGASDMFIAKNDYAKIDVDGLYSNLLGPGN